MKYEYSTILPLVIFTYVFFPMLIVGGIRKLYLKQQKNFGNFFNKDETSIIKGICIIIVMLTHYSTRAKNPSVLFYLWFGGYLSVAIFLLVSGYAMYVQFKRKGEAFFKGFLFHRCFRLILPFFLVSTVMSLLNKISIKTYFYNLITMQIPRGKSETFGVTWFMVAMLFFSLCFYLCFKYMKEKTALIAILVLSTIYMFVCIGLKCGVWWYDTTYCFMAGILLAKYKEKVLSFCHKYRFAIFGISGIGVAALVLLMSKGYSENIGVLFACDFFAIFLVITLFLLVDMRNPVLKLIGEMSWEVFLTHSTIQIFIYGEQISQNGYSIFGVIFVVMVASYCLHCVDNKVMQWLKKG